MALVGVYAVGARIARPGRIDKHHVPADGQWPPLRRKRHCHPVHPDGGARREGFIGEGGWSAGATILSASPEWIGFADGI